MSKPTAEEIELIKQLKDKVSDLALSPNQLREHELARWIRAGGQDVGKADEMIRKSVAWRKENDMEDLLSWTPPTRITDTWKIVLEGTDAENSPILISYAGQSKMVDMLRAGLKNDMTKFTLRNYELALQEREGKLTPEGYPVSQVVLITDYTGLPLSSLLVKEFGLFWVDLVRIMEMNYPNTLKKMIGMNSGSLMSVLYNLAKPFMSQETANRTLMCGQNPHKFREMYLQNIQADQLCPRFGGTKKCTYEFCCNLEAQQEYTTVSVKGGEKYEVPVEISKSATVLYWSFYTKDHEIHFGIKTTNGDYIVPQEQVGSNLEKIEGSIVCEKAGKYVVEFHNRDSKRGSEELMFFVTTVSPLN